MSSAEEQFALLKDKFVSCEQARHGDDNNNNNNNAIWRDEMLMDASVGSHTRITIKTAAPTLKITGAAVAGVGW